MKSIADINRELRQYNKKDSKLLFFCICLSQCLMSAYAVVMWSPTVLKILPEGGDSRKQVMAVFIFTCIGCVVFVSYAAMLFFKQRSRQTGILMALGIEKKILKNRGQSFSRYIPQKLYIKGKAKPVLDLFYSLRS